MRTAKAVLGAWDLVLVLGDEILSEGSFMSTLCHTGSIWHMEAKYMISLGHVHVCLIRHIGWHILDEG